MLDCFFPEEQQKPISGQFGRITYKALMALAFNDPMILAVALKVNDDTKFALTSAKIKSGRLIKFPHALEILFKKIFQRFSIDIRLDFIKEICNYLKNEAKMSKELLESEHLTKLFFEMGKYSQDPQLIAIYKEFLVQFLFQKQQKACFMISGTPLLQIKLLNDVVEYCIGNLLSPQQKNNTFSIHTFLQIVYSLENLVLSNESIITSQDFINLFIKIITLIDKADLLYISLPNSFFFDERNSQAFVSDRKPNLASNSSYIPREGGVLRIVLKIVFLQLKQNILLSAFILRYLLFREQSDRKTLKAMCGWKKPKAERKKQEPALEKFTALDIGCTKNKQYEVLNEVITKKVIGPDVGLLGPRKKQKVPIQEKGIFDQGPVLIMYVISQIFQLLHFELFGITSYKNFPGEDARMKILFEINNKEKKPSEKFRLLSMLLNELFTFQDKGKRLMQQLASFPQIIDKLKPNISNCFFKEIPLGTFYSPLDGAINIASKDMFYPDEGKQSGPPKHFENEWSEFITNLTETIKKSTTGSNNMDLFQQLLVRRDCLAIMQPYLQFVTTHCFYPVEFLIAKGIKNLDMLEGLQTIETRKELKGKIKEKPMKPAKMEHEELRKNIEDLGGQIYRRFEKELKTETGVLFDKKEEKIYREVIDFIDRRYTKKLKRTYPNIRAEHKKELVAISEYKDGFGRMMRLKKLKNIENSEHYKENYQYLLHYTIKKFLIARCIDKRVKQKLLNKEFLLSEFKFPHIIRPLITKKANNELVSIKIENTDQLSNYNK